MGPTPATLIKSLILSQLDHYDIVYEWNSEQHLIKLQIIQNSACKTLILADKTTPIV